MHYIAERNKIGSTEMHYIAERNSTRSLVPTSETHDIGHIFNGILIIFVVVIFISNILVIVIFFTMKNVNGRKVSNLLLLNQAVVDMLIGVTTIPRIICLQVCNMTTYNITIFFTSYTMYFAVGLLIMCTIERYISVKMPLFHLRYATARKILCVFLLIAVLTVAPAFVNIFLPDKMTSLRQFHIGEKVCLGGGVLLVFSLLWATYRVIRYSIKNRITMRQEQVVKKTVTKTEIDLVDKEREIKVKTLKVFLLMSIIYTITIVPHIVGEFMLCMINPTQDVVFVTKTSLYICYISSSVINPFLTLRYKPDYKKAVLKFTNRRKERTIESDT